MLNYKLNSIAAEIANAIKQYNRVIGTQSKVIFSNKIKPLSINVCG